MSVADSKALASHSTGGDLTPKAAPGDDTDGRDGRDGRGGKKAKHSLFRLGNKADGEDSPATEDSHAARSLSRDTSKLSSMTRSPTSPTRGGLSSSPRLSSPAGSQIFERDVQDSISAMPTSPAIPSHIQTEDHIPPVLDASSEAITDDHLDPDSVEIITHNAHQPAAVTVTGVTYEQMAASWAEELGVALDHQQRDDVSSHGALDGAADVRRLSFISFADVVQLLLAVADPVAGVVAADEQERLGAGRRDVAGAETAGEPDVGPPGGGGGGRQHRDHDAGAAADEERRPGRGEEPADEPGGGAGAGVIAKGSGLAGRNGGVCARGAFLVLAHK
jgi:hypothetical protein